MTQSLRVGIVGFGRMGQEFARIIQDMPGVQVTAVVEPNDVNRSKAKEGGLDAVSFSDLEGALHSMDLDGWIISSSTHSHVPIARTLLARGARILLEKPIAESKESALLLQDLVAPNSSNLMMGHILLWSDEFSSLRTRVGEREGLRKITALRQRTASHRIDYPDESPFSLLMVHDLYCIQVLTGGAEPTSISGRTVLHEQGGQHCAKAILEWGDNTIAHAESNYFLPDGQGSGVDDVFTVEGSDWQESVNYKGDFQSALRNEVNQFIALLRGEATVPIGARFKDAVQVQGWVDQLIASAQGNGEKGE